MAHSHCTGPGQGQGPGNDGFLYYPIYCSHYTGRGTGTGNHCFLLYPSRSQSLSRSQSRAVWMSHEGGNASLWPKIMYQQFSSNAKLHVSTYTEVEASCLIIVKIPSRCSTQRWTWECCWVSMQAMKDLLIFHRPQRTTNFLKIVY